MSFPSARFKKHPKRSSVAHRPKQKSGRDTSWEKSSAWYEKTVGLRGHYYHRALILPGVERLLALKPDSKLLDLGCGQGVLARLLTKRQTYVGIDVSAQLIEAARRHDAKHTHTYVVADATKPLLKIPQDFSHAAAILSLQNMEDQRGAIHNAAKHLVKDGTFIMVLNHPYFRIPRQSGWGINEQSKQQYRWVTRYLSALSIPIAMHPGKKDGWDTWSFHLPLSTYTSYLAEAGFVVEKLEEWASDKKSAPGPNARREDLARDEIPLFMTIVARKVRS